MMMTCSLFVPKDEGEETLLLLLISESIVRSCLIFHLIIHLQKVCLQLKSDAVSIFS